MSGVAIIPFIFIQKVQHILILLSVPYINGSLAVEVVQALVTLDVVRLVLGVFEVAVDVVFHLLFSDFPGIPHHRVTPEDGSIEADWLLV